MKKVIVLSVLLILVGTTSAQDSTKILRHGIEFQVYGLMSITNFNGYTFAYQYLFNENNGLRFGISNRISNMIDEANTTSDSSTYFNSESSTYIEMDLSTQYLYRIKAYKEFKLLIGAGPLIGYQYSYANQKDYYSGYTVRAKSKKNGIKFGFDIILGVEYQLTKNIVFSGEYDIQGTLLLTDYEYDKTYNYFDSDEEKVAHTSGEIKTFRMERSRANLGITIFF